MQETSHWNQQPAYQPVDQEEALEKQLEQLFSGNSPHDSRTALNRLSAPDTLSASLQRPLPAWLVRAIQVALIVLAALLTGFLVMGITRNLALSAAAPAPPPNTHRSKLVPLVAALTFVPPAMEPATPQSSPGGTATQAGTPAGEPSGTPPDTTPTHMPTTPPSVAVPTSDETVGLLELKRRTPTPEKASAVLPTLAPVTIPLAGPTSWPTRLHIPAIQLEAPIVPVGIINYQIDGQAATTWDVPSRFAAGWHRSSAQPGQAGNMVLNGHQDIYGGVFRNLAALQTGDEIVVYAGDTLFSYRVAERHLLAEQGQPLSVRARNAQWIMPTQDERLTLVTCAPDARATHRLIILALPVSP